MPCGTASGPPRGRRPPHDGVDGRRHGVRPVGRYLAPRLPPGGVAPSGANRRRRNTVSTSLTNTGADSGSSTLTRTDLIYAADPNAIDPNGYFQEFNPGGDMDMYPMMNYYNQADYRWESFNGAGYYDQTSVRFRNFDTRARATIGNAADAPGGSYSDLYTRAFDLTKIQGKACNLSFYTAGAYRTTRPSEMNDQLEISMSINCGATWVSLTTLTGGALANNGLVESQFVPGWMGNWKEQGINIPEGARSERVYFRFRYRPGTDIPSYTGGAFGTGNHFYMDRLRISNAPLGIDGKKITALGMSVSPNPTSGAATVRINGGDNSTADVTVTDVTGKLVFNSSVKRSTTSTQIEIPASAIAVKGMYLVKVVTNGATETQKLVVY